MQINQLDHDQQVEIFHNGKLPKSLRKAHICPQNGVYMAAESLFMIYITRKMSVSFELQIWQQLSFPSKTMNIPRNVKTP